MEQGCEPTLGRPLLVSQQESQGGGGQLESSPGRRHRGILCSVVSGHIPVLLFKILILTDVSFSLLYKVYF